VGLIWVQVFDSDPGGAAGYDQDTEQFVAGNLAKLIDRLLDQPTQSRYLICAGTS